MAPTNTQLPELLDEEAFCRLIDASRRKVQLMRQTGTGPAYRKLCGSVRYAVPDVIAWLESCRRRSTSDTGPDLSM